MNQELCLTNEIKDYLSLYEGDKVISHGIKAQLQIIEFIEHPHLYQSCFDLLLENLTYFLEEIDDPSIKKQMQRRSASMINCMIFFMEAKLIFDINKNKQEGLELAKKACYILAETTTEFIVNGANKYSAVISGKKLFENLFLNKGNQSSFLHKAINWYFNGKHNENKEINFYLFIDATFDKIKRNEEIFGKSLLISELIYRYKDSLTHFNMPLPLTKQKSDTPFVYTCIISAIIDIVMLIVGIAGMLSAGNMKILNKMGVVEINKDSWYNSSWDWFYYSLLGTIGAMLVIFIIGRIRFKISNINYQKALNKLDIHYTEMAKSFR